MEAIEEPYQQSRQPPPESPPPLLVAIAPSSIVPETKSIIATTTAFIDDLVTAVPPSQATFANFLRQIIDNRSNVNCRLDILGYLLARVSPDATVREASSQAQKLIEEYEEATLARQDIAARIAAVFDKSEEDGTLDAQDRYILARMRSSYIHSGANVTDAATRERLRVARGEVRNLLAAALKTMGEAKDGGIWFPRSDLEGLPSGWLSTLKMGDDGATDKLCVPLDDASYMQIMRSASNEQTRRRVYVARQQCFPENKERLAKIALLRDEIARLLGFDNHAAMKVEQRMARSVAEIESRLEETMERLKPLATTKMEMLLQLKKKDLASRRGIDDAAQKAQGQNEGDVSQVFVWDRMYYDAKQRIEMYSVDTLKLAEYFEASHTLKRMLDVFERLFGMRFEVADIPRWHDTVVACTAWDSEEAGGGFLGYLYLDIFSRPGKFRNAYHMPIQSHFTEANGTRHFPVSILSCSFPQSTPHEPSLLQHRDVKIMFHELGHAIHNLVTDTKYHISHSKDFGEIPSNLLENWIWVPEVLVSLGKHHTHLANQQPTGQQHEAQLPSDLAQGVAQTKILNEASNTLAMIQLALFDLKIYSPANSAAIQNLDLTRLWNELRSEVLPYSCSNGPEDVGFGYAGVSHYFRSYDVGYYAYPMSKIYSADLYGHNFAVNPMDPAAGRRWRDRVLRHGSSQSELDTLEAFLGREMNSEGFFREVEKSLRQLE